MDPLLVVRRVGELVDLVLRDGQPVGGGHMLANAGGQIGELGKDFHAPHCRQMRAALLSMRRQA